MVEIRKGSRDRSHVRKRTCVEQSPVCEVSVATSKVKAKTSINFPRSVRGK
jgi:hypothetical protein